MRKTNESADISNDKKDKSTRTLQKITMVVLIPLLFASAVLLTIAIGTDVNVFDQAKDLTAKLPFVNKEKDESMEQDTVILEERVVNLQAEIQEKEAQVFKLQQQLESSAEEKDALLIEQERLILEIEALERGRDSTKQKFAEIVTTFEKMSAKSAAPVITKMSDAEAIQILTNLKSDNLASILEKMSPEDAAKYMTIMAK